MYEELLKKARELFWRSPAFVPRGTRSELPLKVCDCLYAAHVVLGQVRPPELGQLVAELSSAGRKLNEPRVEYFAQTLEQAVKDILAFEMACDMEDEEVAAETERRVFAAGKAVTT